LIVDIGIKQYMGHLTQENQEATKVIDLYKYLLLPDENIGVSVTGLLHQCKIFRHKNSIPSRY
jgi:hypothetical protein